MGFIRKFKSLIGQQINATDAELNFKSLAKALTHDIAFDVYADPKSISLIRAREFDQLRAVLLKNGKSPNLDVPDALLDKHRLNKLHHPAQTLKKIDDIEAEMSKLWCKTVLLDPSKGKFD